MFNSADMADSSVLDIDECRQDMWMLVGRLPGQDQLSKIQVQTSPFVVGRRREGVQLRLQDPHVSGLHALLSPVPDGMYIRDLGSSNGTYFHGQRITAPVLAGLGETVAFAGNEFRIDRLEVEADRTETDPGFTKISFENLDQNWTLSNFAKLLQPGGMTPSFQPLARLSDLQFVGFEGLARSEIVGLELPAKMFGAAHLLDQCAELSVACRRDALTLVAGLDAGWQVWLNTHPSESLAEQVLPSLKLAREQAAHLELVIEIHEELSDALTGFERFSDELRDLGVKLALDDFGAGRSRQRELLRLRPEYVKFDRSMIADLPELRGPSAIGMKSYLDLLRSLEVCPVAEGIETREELEACADLGFELGQGYAIGRPDSIRAWRLVID